MEHFDKILSSLELQLPLKLPVAMRGDFILGQHNLTDRGDQCV